ncbi:MAG: hypothetical protein LBJ15_19280 [Comamonas sp.]|uniref:hypothetical protein n=1 Tax=Comamonas sp. TaxID=34028 RepID=UPI0028211F0D|nr:hypothetical protein [Comamonas sp.]MDR0216120.1 hypothetical protein [Comamonas sp.]
MATSASTWGQADKAYQAHHFACPQCIAAGARPGADARCTDGLRLWNLYLRAGTPPHFTSARTA